jgi:hypothetical protein
MKTFILFIFINLFTGRTEVLTGNPPKIYYYYCVSSTTNIDVSVSKNTILYTEIYSFNGDETQIKAKSNSWSKYVNQNCNSLSKCTANLNYYPSIEQAQLSLKKFLKQYQNNKKFELRKVEF